MGAACATLLAGSLAGCAKMGAAKPAADAAKVAGETTTTTVNFVPARREFRSLADPANSPINARDLAVAASC
jgi:hypothetical protein